MHQVRVTWAAAGRALLLVTVVAIAACGRPQPPPPDVDASSLRRPPAGALVGFEGQYGSHVWLGVPYARPPVGELRWRAPQPLEASDGTRQALAFGASCPQFASPIGGDDSAELGTPVGSEDCLFLNVYAPPWPAAAVPTGDERLPVMVWIHGGGNTIGTTRFYDGGNLAASQDVIVVTVNYRLGALGWFRHPALAEGASAAERSGNFAVLDLIHALGWVRDNIAAFGGDPDNVTIFGESAGGHNVALLLLSPLAQDLFHRAIIQSGGSWGTEIAEAENYVDDPAPGHENSPQEVTLRLLVADGAAADREAAKAQVAALGSAEVARRLRALPALEILAPYKEEGIGMYDLPRAIRDGAVLPRESFAERFATPGGVHAVPIMLGTNRDENKLFLFLNPEYVRRWFGIFPQVLDAERFQLLAEYLSRSWKATGADELAAALTGSGHTNVYVYRFDWDEEPSILWADLGELLGASHGFEIPFIFGHWDLGREGRFLFDDDSEPGRSELARAMMSYWTAFAYDGDPGRGRGGDVPRWSAWDPQPGADKFAILDTAADGGPRMARDVVTSDQLLAELKADPRLADAELRCDVLAGLTRWSNAIGDPEYASAGCAPLPAVAAAED